MNFVYVVSVIISLCFFNVNATILKGRNRCHGKIYISNSGSRAYKGLDHDVEKTKIPLKFDAREKWPKCKSLFRISDQGYCGGCWAFASSSVMADRLCIQSEQNVQDFVSTQDLLECCKKCVAEGDEFVGGCEGGYAEDAFDFWTSDGLVTGFHLPKEGCKPINKRILKGTPYKTCRQKCTNKNYTRSYNDSKTFGRSTFVQRRPLKKGLEQIQIELMKNGPLVALMDIYDYFGAYGENAVMYYDKEKVEKDEMPTAHAIKIIGWDVTKEGTPVWIMANSWGDDWCDSGFCRIKRGVNELNIEEYPMIGGLPKKILKKRRSNNTDKFRFVSSDSDIFICSLSLNVIVTLGLHFL